MNPEAFAAAAGISRETSDKFKLYHDFIEKWQPRINLVGKGTIESIRERHFLDSAQAFALLEPGDRVVVDLGSGAGFPGLVLALLAADAGRATVFHLVESDSRKAAFLAEAARALALGAGVRVHPARAETLAASPLARAADAVTARALAALPALCALAAPLLAPAGRCVFLKGARHADEVAAARAAGWRFDLATHPSRTEPGAALLVLRGLARDSRGGL